MFARLKALAIIFAAFPAIYLLLYGTLPVAVSAMYGGQPPEHIGRLLDKQMETFQEISRLLFSPLGSSPKKEEKVAGLGRS
jgi:hypothetical protein